MNVNNGRKAMLNTLIGGSKHIQYVTPKLGKEITEIIPPLPVQTLCTMLLKIYFNLLIALNYEKDLISTLMVT